MGYFDFADFDAAQMGNFACMIAHKVVDFVVHKVVDFAAHKAVDFAVHKVVDSAVHKKIDFVFSSEG